MIVKVKPQYADTYVGFGKGTETLGKRQDIHELAIIAIESGDKSLLQMFEILPTLEELKKYKTDLELKALRK